MIGKKLNWSDKNYNHHLIRDDSNIFLYVLHFTQRSGVQVQKSGPSRTYVALAGPKSAVGHFTTEWRAADLGTGVYYVTTTTTCIVKTSQLHHIDFYQI